MALVAVVAVLVYLPSLRYELVFDDLSLIGPQGPVWLGGEWLPYRPLRYLSLQLDSVIGGGHAWAYHTTNLVLHACACASVTAIAARLGARALPALLGGLTLALHPLCVEAVAYVAGRRDLLAALLGLGGLIAWMSPRGKSGVAIVLLLAGVAAKESALVFWPVLLAASWFGFGPRLGYAVRTLGMSLVAAIALPVAYGAIGPSAPTRGLADLVSVFGRTAAHYAGGLIWPVGLSVEYPLLVCANDCSCSAKAAAIVGIGLLALGGLATAALAGRARRLAAPMPVAFALSWSFAVLLALAVVIGRQEPGADRHAYPLVAAVATLLALGITRSGVRVGVLAMLVWALALSAAGATTVRRIPAWESSRSLWTETVATTPRSLRARFNLAALFAGEGEHRTARRHLRAALRTHSDYGHAHAALAWLDCRDRRLVRARHHIERAHDLGAPFALIEAAEAECREVALPR